tara:strand:- start:1487 stop:2281 length:795 start_codon:yes stop_codon:yes gene_type:complete
MQFDEQPMLALNKSIKYGAMLLCGLFIVPALKIRNLYDRKILGYLEHKTLFIFNICKGFLISLVIMAPLIYLFKYFDIRTIDYELLVFDKYFIYTIIFTLFISFLISIIEESFFRGIMIQKSNNFITTFFIVLSGSLAYSLFHFIKIPLIISETIYWNTGLIELLDVFTNFFETISYDSALTLLMFGVLLALVRLNLNTISYCIGLHAGFVFTIKIFKQSSSVNFDSSFYPLLSSHDHFLGNLATTWITIVLLIYLIYLYKERQ